jgi:uncharacterized phage protein (TIGR01671 family)
MREIKFRAWDESDKVYYYSDDAKRFWSLSNFFKLAQGLKNYPNNIQQFTGLKDSKGVEIYEGDIIRYAVDGCHQDQPIEVKWHVAGFELFSQVGDPYYRMDLNSIEVIGNIYSNPQLLKGVN